MYAIFRKAIDENNHYLTVNGEKVTSKKHARKYRNYNIAVRDFIFLSSKNPEYLWTIRDIKTGILFETNVRDVLKIWNKS